MASACGMVRGKPSNRQPRLQSPCFSRSFTSPMMISSDTSCPASIPFFAAMPISFCLALPRIRNPRAAEIERITFLVEHHFHHVRTGKRLRIVNRVAGRGNAGLLLFVQDACNFGYQRRLHQGLVALEVDDDVVLSEVQ